MSQKSIIQPMARAMRPAAESLPADSSRKTPVRVALVEDEPKVRESWVRLINSLTDISCVCACASGERLSESCPRNNPTPF